MSTNDERPIATPDAGGPNDQRPADRPRQPPPTGGLGRRPEPSVPPVAPAATSRPAGQPNRGHGRRPGGQGSERPAAEHRDDRRRRDGKHGPDRKSFAGFGDENERAFCDAAVHLLPETFPVLHRQGAATLRVIVVATRTGAILLCDGAHSGPHRWPSGDEVTDAATSPRPPTSATAFDANSSAVDDTDANGAQPAVDDHGEDDA